MDKKELEQLIEKGESQTLEFKKSLAEKNEILESISAFANTEGGCILVGIEEDKEGSVKNILGINTKGKVIEGLVNEIKQNTDPVIFPSIKIERIKDRNMLLIEIKENTIKPVFAKGKIYKRVGKTNQKLSTLEIRELTRESVDYNFTELVCKECEIEDIDEEKITNKEYQEINNVSKPTATRELNELLNKEIFIKYGVTGKGTYYTLFERAHKGLTGK